MLRLVWRNLSRHPVRSLLTLGSLVVALFLLCLLRSLVTTLESGVKDARSNRLVVQSAVSLFVEMPLAYQPRIAALEGVESTCKWQWFGGYYQSERNFFAQFAVDQDSLFDVYPEIGLVDHPRAAGRTPAQQREEFLSVRTACIIGDALAEEFGWSVGDTIPLIGGIFPPAEGETWSFRVAGIYRPGSSSVDARTMYFRWDYFQRTLEEGPDRFTPGMGVLMLRTAPDADQQRLMADVERMFEHGPQRVQCTTEAEFQAQFVSMVGNVPFFVASIGGGVLIAILLACVNTMLMAGREQTHDVGILKALGFTDRTAFTVLIGQSLLLCALGGGLGVLAALQTEPMIARALGVMFPNYAVAPETVALGLAISVGIGLVAGIMPAWTAGRLRVVEALRSVH